MTTIQIHIPATPHAALNPNSREHYFAVSRNKKVLKTASSLATKNVVNADPAILPAVKSRSIAVTYTIYWEKGRITLDGDNALSCLKAATDGIAESLEVNDKRFVFMPVQQKRAKALQGWIDVELRVIGGK